MGIMWILLIVSIALCVFSHIVNKRYDNPAFLFTIVWSFIFILLTTQLYEIPLSDQSTIILMVMIIAFPLGTFVSIGFNQRKNAYIGLYDKQFVSMYSYDLRKKIFWVISIASILIMFIDEISIINNVLSGASFLDVIKENGGVETVTISGWKAVFYLYMIYPVTYFISPICAVEIFSNNARKMPYILLNLVMIFLAVMHHGARLNIVIAIISYVFCMYIYDKKITIPNKVKRLLLGCIVIAVVAIIWLSASRGIDNIWGSFYIYFLCEIPVMDSLLNSDIINGHTMGFLSFNGFTYPLFTILKMIGISNPDVYTYTQTIRQFLENNWVNISAYGHRVNAFLPAGAFFYIDGGYGFEFIGVFFSGIFSNHIYRNMLVRKNPRIIATYLLIIVAIILSFFRFYGTSYQFVLALIYIQFLYKKWKCMERSKDESSICDA